MRHETGDREAELKEMDCGCEGAKKGTQPWIRSVPELWHGGPNGQIAELPNEDLVARGRGCGLDGCLRLGLHVPRVGVGLRLDRWPRRGRGRGFVRKWVRGWWGGCVVGICSCGPPGRGALGEVFHWLRDARGGIA